MESYSLLRSPAAIAGVLDYRGRPITKPGSGRWTAASFILVMGMAERAAYNGIVFNLINYMTGPLGESTAAAATNVTVWGGSSLVLPIICSLFADSFLSRYRTIVFSSFLYILGLGLLSLSAAVPNRSQCLSEHGGETTVYSSCPPNTYILVLFYFALYLVAIAQSFHRPSLQAFGADQFDESDREENIWRSSYFNWWIFVLGVSMTVSPITLSYIQDNVNWSIGFGIPCILLSCALVLFFLGSRFYRCNTLNETRPHAQLGQAFAALFERNLFSRIKSEAEEENERHTGSYNQSNHLELGGETLMAERMEEAKGILRMLPIWATCLGFTLVMCQWETFFTKQGGTLDRKFGPNFQVPPAGLQSLSNLTSTVFILFYDRIAVPLARNRTGNPSGITKLQRIGTGLLVSTIMMVVSALVEMRRLETARKFGLEDDPSSVIPMSIVWLFPQYILMGIVVVFAIVGLQEFFYDQMPDGLRSVGIALVLCISGVGSFVNSFLVYVIDKATRSINGETWFSDNLNRAHLDYFYWFIALINLCAFILYIYFARSYVYKQKK